MRIFLCQNHSGKISLPIGVPYAQLVLAAHIEDIADVGVSGYSKDGVIPSTKEIMKQIKKFKPDIVGITVDWAFLSYANIEMAKKVKEWNSDVTVIAGGQHATWTAEELINTGYFDAIFLGEAEISFREYVQKGDFGKVTGVLYKDGENIINTGRAPCIDLDQLKPPAYHLLGTEGLRLAMAVESSRGCPHKCDFCETRNFFGNGQYRRMSPRHFVNNLAAIVDRVGGGFFTIIDDNFTLDMRGSVKEICERLVAEELPVQFIVNARTEEVAKNLDLLPLMEKAGIRAILMGIESIFDKVLKSMKKSAQYNPDDIKRIFKTCENMGISPFVSVVFGYGETPEMVSKTFDFLIDLDPFGAHLNIATPFPGSDLYKRADANGEILTKDYSLYDRSHRVWGKVPENIMEPISEGRRRFYQRPEHIYRINKMGLESPDIEAFIGIGLLGLELTFEERSQPRSSSDWKRIMTGYNRVLRDYFVPSNTGYNKKIRFAVDQTNFILTVKNGTIKEIETDRDDWDLNLSTDVITMLDLMVWNSRDILSSFVLGNVKTEANLEEKLEFISWFTDLQVKLRWVGKSKMQVPRLRHAIQDWMEEDERRLDRFKELYADGTILYVGDKKRAGLKLRFSDSSILDVTLGLDSQEKYNFEMLIPGKEVDKIFSGEVNLLHEILANREIKFKSAEKAKFEIDPQTFFENMKKDFNPKKATGVNLLIQYRIDTDQAEENWWVQIKDHAIKIEKGINDKKPSVELYIKMNNFLKLINRFLTPMELFSGGNITYKGSPYFMLDLIKCLDDSTYETPGPVKPSLQSN